MRVGTSSWLSFLLAWKRIIPTHVGTRALARTSTFRFADHPHACGDKLPDNIFHDRAKGSSPRMWGQVCHFFQLLGSSGIIPTRVGTSAKAVCTSVKIQDHPHACGDKKRCLTVQATPLGSSPRVWGQGPQQ